jgi:hypothetical protein
MSYYEATVGKLSPAQISKLLNGHAARITGGSVHKVKLSHEQAKKFHKAKMCGKAVQVRFDPYQIQMHQGLRKTKGGSFFSDTKHWYENAIPAKYRAPIESLAMAGAQDLGAGLRRRGRPRKQKGGSMFGMLSKGAKLAVERAGPIAMKQLKPIVKKLANKVVDYGVAAAGPAAIMTAPPAAGSMP